MRGKGKWRLGIEISTGRCNCWTCGGHSLKYALARASNCYAKYIESLLGKIWFEKFTEPTRRNNKLRLPKGVGELQQCHNDYLWDRGFDPEELQRLWKIAGIGLVSYLQWSIFIPVNLNNETVSWTTRSITKEGKYSSARPEHEIVRLKDTLYGVDLARTAIIICEGPTDVWRVGPGAVATFGVALTSSQVNMISRFPKRIICFDSDRAGRKKAESIAFLLSGIPGRTIKVELDAEDPASASQSEIRRLRKLAFGEK